MNIKEKEQALPTFFEKDGYTFVFTGSSLKLFSVNSNIRNVRIPTKINNIPVTKIGRNCFRGNKNIKNIAIPSSIVEIEGLAFADCSALTKISLPKSLLRLGSNVFDGCTNLKSIGLPESLQYMTNNPFKGCVNLEKILVSPKNKFFIIVDGVLYTHDRKSLICYPAGLNNELYEILPETETIKSCAFYGAKKIKKVFFSKSIKYIDTMAFANCESLSSIKIPNNVAYLSPYVFKACTSLQKVQIHRPLKKGEQDAFIQCDKLSKILVH